jgi:acyl dehydratase
MSETFEHRLVARNPATESENRIHGDEVALRYGFKGGLVPGVTVYAYACAPILEALGEEWLERGSTSMRFSAPSYDGESLTAMVAPAGGGDSGQLHSITVQAGGRTSATGTASTPRNPGTPEDIGWAPLPEERPPASEEVFAPGTLLGTIQLPTDQERMSAYLQSIEEPSPLYSRRGIVHPGWLLNGANSILVANVVMPAWLHVESRVQHRRPVTIGESVQVRGIVAEAFERKGHRFIAIDVAWMAVDRPGALKLVANARHTAIWRLSGQE